MRPVYACDVTADAKVRSVRPPELRVKARYVSTIVNQGGNAEAARLWNRFLSSSAGQKILRKHGLSTPILQR